ncbi:MAG: prenyltransferase [Deltaproteobacteria bacterium]|nr:prenyltransferase [Deltaproteobacteria bacterium]
MSLFKRVSYWIVNARYHACAQSLLPAVLAVCLAAGVEGFSPVLGAAAVLGVVLTHLGVNLLDDYFDFRRGHTGCRDVMARGGMRARIAKCPYLTDGKSTTGDLFAASCVFCFLGLVCAAVIWSRRGTPVVWFALATALTGLEYSGWPARLSYRGLGEIVIGLVFGPLLMNGVYLAACGRFAPSVLLVSIPVGLLVMNIVYAHAIMDVEPDKKVGKATLAVLAGSNRARLAILAFLLAVPYLLVSLSVALGWSPKTFLLVFLTLPMAAALYGLMARFASDPAKAPARRFWMGPMNRWKVVQANGIEWFMVRWYLARNLLLFFCLSIIVARAFSLGG